MAGKAASDKGHGHMVRKAHKDAWVCGCDGTWVVVSSAGGTEELMLFAQAVQ